MYFMAKSCTHTVHPPEPDQNMSCLSPISLASTEFHENIEIPWKRANSAARLKILHFAENCGLYCTRIHILLCITVNAA